MATAGNSLTKTAHQCRHCHRSFFPKRTDRTKFCSRECAYAYRAAQTRAKVRVSKPIPERNCSVCGNVFAAKFAAICSESCRKAQARKKALLASVRAHAGKRCKCAQCGSEFAPEYGSKRRTYCSEQCAHKAQRKYQVRGSHRRRAKAFGARYQYVNPRNVFKRDNWTCQICGVETPSSLRGSYDARAPELDHIVPLSKGLAHACENLQCACRHCNGKKSNQLDYQPYP